MQPRHVAAGVGAGLALWLLWRRLRRRQDAKAGASALHATVVHASAGGRAQPHAVLHTGRLMPLVGLGTWKAKAGDVERAVRAAIEAGYRHIDCAKCYDNEKEVGAAIRGCLDAGVCAREDLFVTSKLWNTEKKYARDVRNALENTLRDLQLDYLDLYLIHWPVAFGRVVNCACHGNAGDGVICPFPKRADGGLKYDDAPRRVLKLNSGDLDAIQVPHAETWRALEGCVDGGLATHIGVSNFNEAQLQALLDACTVRPAVNQIELHPYNASAALCAYCAEQGVLLTSYCVLGHGSGAGVPLLESPVVAAIAERRGMTPAQVLIRFQTERGAARRRTRGFDAIGTRRRYRGDPEVDDARAHRVQPRRGGPVPAPRARGPRRAPRDGRGLAVLRRAPRQAPGPVPLQGRAARAHATREAGEVRVLFERIFSQPARCAPDWRAVAAADVARDPSRSRRPLVIGSAC